MTSTKHTAKKQAPTITFVMGNNGVVAPGSSTTSTRLTFNGNAGNGHEIVRLQMYDGTEEWGHSTATNEVGFWEFIPPHFGLGEHSITVRSIPEGAVSNVWGFKVVTSD